jgi:glutamine amidotransferase-like uncharacterized protein
MFVGLPCGVSTMKVCLHRDGITRAILLGLVASIAILCWQVGDTTRSRTVDRDGDSDVLEGIATETSTRVRVVKPAVGILVSSHEEESDFLTLQRLLRSRGIDKVSMVSASEVKSSGLGANDVVLVPGGRARPKVLALGGEGLERLRMFVEKGGGYVGICGGAFLALSDDETGSGLVNASSWRGTVEWLGKGVMSLADRGAGMVSVELSNDGMKCFPKCPRFPQMHYAGGPVFIAGHRHDVGGFATLAWFRSEISSHEADVGTMINSPAIIMARYGGGRVILFSPHPEVDQDFEDMVADAVAVVASPRYKPR